MNGRWTSAQPRASWWTATAWPSCGAIGFGLGRKGREHVTNKYSTVEELWLYEKFVVTCLDELARTGSPVLQ